MSDKIKEIRYEMKKINKLIKKPFSFDDSSKYRCNICEKVYKGDIYKSRDHKNTSIIHEKNVDMLLGKYLELEALTDIYYHPNNCYLCNNYINAPINNNCFKYKFN